MSYCTSRKGGFACVAAVEVGGWEDLPKARAPDKEEAGDDGEDERKEEDVLVPARLVG